MKKEAVENETYVITLKWLIGGIGGFTIEDTDKIANVIELYMYRNGYNAIVLQDGVFIFTEVELCDPKTKEKETKRRNRKG